METDAQRFGAFWQQHRDRASSQMTNHILEMRRNKAFTTNRDELQVMIAEGHSRWIAALSNNDLSAIKTYRLEQNIVEIVIVLFSLEEFMDMLDATRLLIIELLGEFYGDHPWNTRLLLEIEDAIHGQRTILASMYHRTSLETTSRLNQQVEAQNSLIRDLSTPIVPIYQGVLVLPLVGNLDPHRANQITETLLEGIVEHQADVVIIDITGVSDVDTSVINYLLLATKASKMIGAHSVLCGIGPQIAQTIVHLGLDLGDLVTRANLQSSIEYALRRQGYAIRAVDG